MLTLVKLALSWLYSHATFKLYLSQLPIGRHIGGHDIPQIPNGYIILDVRAGDRIVVLGYFQLS